MVRSRWLRLCIATGLVGLVYGLVVLTDVNLSQETHWMLVWPGTWVGLVLIKSGMASLRDDLTVTLWLGSAVAYAVCLYALLSITTMVWRRRGGNTRSAPDDGARK
jgi:hypothetical protein